MANRNYSDINPANAKESKLGMQNNDGRLKGGEYDEVGPSKCDFKKVLFPNESVSSLGSEDGAEA